MLKISAVVITFNEEAHIRDCILSLQQVADEIVILDSFSTDHTPDICKDMGVRFYQKKFESYGTQKTDATNLATFNTILSLDADERLDEQLVQSILQIKNTHTSEVFLINRKTFYGDHWVKYCGWYPDYKIRLWNKNHAAWNLNSLHEFVIPKDKQTKVLKLAGHILHYSYSSSSDHKIKLQHFSNIAAKDLFEKGHTSNWLLMYIKPILKFFKIYFVKLGFLDGSTGFQISKISAWGVYIKYKYLSEWRPVLKDNI